MSYVEKKVAHLKRLALVGQKETGRGIYGGACPDWLKQQRDEENKKRSLRMQAQAHRSRAEFFFGR